MLNIMEVHETNQMIEQEKLDVRTITMGISLLDCASDDVDKTCDNIYRKDHHLCQGPRFHRQGHRTRLRHPDRQQAHHRHPDLTGRCQLLQDERGFRQDRPRA